MSIAVNYLLLQIGHRVLKWHLERIRNGTFTVSQVAGFYCPNPNLPEYNTIQRGLRELLKMKPEEMPIEMR